MTQLHPISDTHEYKLDSYDNDLASKLLELSDVQYIKKEHLKNYVNNYGYKNYKFFTLHGCQAFGVTTDKYLIIAFRGTQVFKSVEVRDWFPHFQFNRIKLPDGRVLHTGYYDFYNQIRDKIKSYVGEYGRDKTILLTGHSMGGTVASIAGDIDFPNAIVYSFGATRAMKSSNIQVNKNIYTITIYNDILSDFPTRIQRLVHIGNRYTFTKTGKLENADSVKNRVIENTLLAGVALILPIVWVVGMKAIFVRKGIKSHFIEQYRERIGNYALNRNK